MLEQDLIQTRGFHNTYEDGKATGFQFCVRLIYYRGIYLSQLRPHGVTVDGEVFPKEEIIWCVGGKDYTYEEMKTLGDVHWNIVEPAVLKIKKKGGLSVGYHEIHASYKYSSSYLPPQLQTTIDDESFDNPMDRMMGNLQQTKKMLLVY